MRRGDRLGRVVAGPHIWQKLGESLRGGGRKERQLGQQAGEISLRIDAVAFGRGDQAPQPGVAGSGFVVAREKPILSPDGDSLQRPLGRVVVDA